MQHFRCQFGMRSLIVALTVMAIAAFVVGSRWRVEEEIQRRCDWLTSRGWKLTTEDGKVTRAVLYAQEATTTALQPDIEALARCEGIESIQIGDMPPIGSSRATIDSFQPLAKLQTLREVAIVNVRVDDRTLATLAASKNLKDVFLNHTLAGNSTLQELAKCSHVKKLALSFTPVKDKDLVELKAHGSLREINLSLTLVSDLSVDTLLTIPSLKTIDLSYTSVSDAALQRGVNGDLTLQPTSLGESRCDAVEC